MLPVDKKSPQPEWFFLLLAKQIHKASSLTTLALKPVLAYTLSSVGKILRLRNNQLSMEKPREGLPEASSADQEKSRGHHRKARLSQTFSALQYPNYRLWFGGQLISLVGTWMQATAQGFLVFELTGSPAYLGYVGFAAGAPSWLFTLYGGVIADRFPRRILLLFAQLFMMSFAVILATLTFTGLIQAWHIIVLAFFLGTANAFDAPARQAFIMELVPKEEMTNAIAINSIMFNSATMVGPAVAGIVYALFGPAWCFTVNGITYLGVITALLLMRLAPFKRPERRGKTLSEVRDGFIYVANNTVPKALITSLGLASLLGLGFITLIPAWSVNVLGGDVTTNGLLHSARGMGAALGGLTIAALAARNIRGKILTFGSFFFPLLLLFYSQIRWLPLSLLVLVGVGFGFMLFVNLANSLIQTTVPDELRGRVMSIFTLSFFGLFPLGSLLSGTIASYIGETNTVTISAVILLAMAALLHLRFPLLRQLT
jgi:MFS family permease